MNAFRLDFLWHARVIHACLADFEAKASIDLETFSLEIVARSRIYRFHPRFHARVGDESRYVHLPDESVVAFNGWLPYFNKQWPIGAAKLLFKEFCAKQGLPTPRMWPRAEAGMPHFIVKNDKSSFGQGLWGPFASHDAMDTRQQLRPGDYYEEFIRGKIVKAWYWEDRLASVEMYDMPEVTGDGTSTLRTLIQRACRGTRTPEWEKHEVIARYQGMSLESVPSRGQVVLADYRYASNLMQGFSDTTSSLEHYKGVPAIDRLAAFAPALWAGIPEHLRPAALYTIDAIADPQGEVRLLEMNCNPAVHPEVYPLMLERLFGARGSAAESQPAPLPASALPLQGKPAPRLVRPIALGRYRALS